MEQTFHILIAGDVQGVGYRRFVESQAKNLQLHGWVRNLRNGDVEAVVRGSLATLNQLVEKLRQGPPSSQVTSVQVRNTAISVPSGFSIINDGELPHE